MSKFNFIKLGVDNKLYNHPMYFENNTTFPFGVCQPVFCQELQPKWSVKGSYNDQLRLAPLPVPTYANVYKQTTFRFVPFVDVCSYYESIVSGQSYNNGTVSFVPERVPVVSNKLLVYFLVYNFCQFSFLNKNSDDETYSYKSNLNNAAFYRYLDESFYITDASNAISAFVPGDRDSMDKGSELVTGDNADFVIQGTDGNYICCRLNFTGRILRSNLIGLGFSLNITDDEPLSLLPILCYFKAYYDRYYPQRDTNWQDTKAFQLIKYFDEYQKHSNQFTFDALNKSSDIASGTNLYNFLKDELSSTFCTNTLDFVSANRRNPFNSLEGSLTTISNDSEGSTVSFDSTPGKLTPTVPNTSPMSWIALKALRKFTHFVSKDAGIGQKLSNWLRVHYGADVANSLFKDSYSVAEFRLDASINPIFSTADTVNGNQGEFLGSFAGAGIGYKGGNKYDFTSPTFGVLVGFSCIVPDSNYYQGNDYQLYNVDKDSIFNPAYDSLGFEITPYGQVISDNGFASSKTESIDFNRGFGYLPRYARLKTRRNIVNGDMSRKQTFDSLCSYYLDKHIVTNSFGVKVTQNEGRYNVYRWTTLPPSASVEWQYINKYPWLANYNRMFYNNGGDPDYYPQYSDLMNRRNDIDDNFVSQMSFEYTLRSSMLPISQSYDTVDDDDSQQKQIKQQ